MDIFWLFIIIFGVVVSVGQKSQKRATEAEMQPQEPESPEAEMERRIREILGDRPTRKMTTKSAEKSATEYDLSGPRNDASKSQNRRSDLWQNGATKSYAAKSDKGNLSASANTVKRQEAIGNSSKNEVRQSSELEQIIDDFSIEKATIYAEILKPKYEEF